MPRSFDADRRRPTWSRAFSYRGLTIVPAFDDARSKEIEQAMLEVASKLGIV